MSDAPTDTAEFPMAKPTPLYLKPVFRCDDCCRECGVIVASRAAHAVEAVHPPMVLPRGGCDKCHTSLRLFRITPIPFD